MPEATIVNAKELPELLNMKQVQQLLGISKPMTYALAHRQGFPVVRFGRAIRVQREALLKWLERQSGEVISV